MLRYRLYAMAILIPLVALSVLFLPKQLFAILTGGIIGWAAWEWSRLAGMHRRITRGMYIVLVVLPVFVLLYILHSIGTDFFNFIARSLPIVLSIVLLLWLWPIAGIIFYAKGCRPLGFQNRWVIAGFGLYVLPVFGFLIVFLQKFAGHELLSCLVLIWSVDIGAYTIGCFMSKHILAKRISPNKTWEGVWGGIGLCLLVSVITVPLPLGFVLRREMITRHDILSLISLLLGTFLLSVFVVFGDLFVSMLKRQIGIKDNGTGLPGHGGILDCINRMLIGLPVYVFLSFLDIALNLGVAHYAI